MQELNLPSYEFRYKEENGQVFIFDEIRKKYVVLTPEEWVRQHFTMFLIDQRRVPAGLIMFEKNIRMNSMSRRPDIVVHSRSADPLMIVECKAPELKLSQAAFDQAARYNSVLKVPYLVVTNGLQHYCCRMEEGGHEWRFLPDIPDYGEMHP